MKVTINGEMFDFDTTRKPLAEALAVEKALGIPYVQYAEGLNQKSMVSLAGFVWLVWRRNGRDVPYEDIESGAVDIDLDTLEIEGDEDGGDAAAGPTTPTPPASSTTGGSTSASSRKSSTSAHGNSAS